MACPFRSLGGLAASVAFTFVLLPVESGPLSQGPGLCRPGSPSADICGSAWTESVFFVWNWGQILPNSKYKIRLLGFYGHMV